MGAAASCDDIVGMDFAATMAACQDKPVFYYGNYESKTDHTGKTLLAPLIKLIFAMGGVEYEEVGLSEEQWKAAKGNENSPVPFDQLPILVDKGKIASGISIGRYIAVRAGLVPEDDMDAAHCDCIVSKILMTAYAFGPVMTMEDKAEQMAAGMAMIESHLKPCIDGLAKILGDKKFFGGDAPNMADAYAYFVFDLAIKKGESYGIGDMVKMGLGKMGKLVTDFEEVDTVKAHLAACAAS